MKKLLAIFLLTVTLYNAGGYMAAFQFFIYRANLINEEQISKNIYKESDLVEIKIPAHLVGIDNLRGYERMSGSVQLAQNAYNYVRMRMTSDTIYVMCIPNYKTTRLYKENVICAREVSDAPFNAKKQTVPVKQIKFTEHINTQITESVAPQYTVASQAFDTLVSRTKPGIKNCIAEPPESFLS